jgi:ankyrin repeat protein
MGNRVAEESVNIATLLLDLGSDVNAENSQRVSVLMVAAELACPQVVSLLIARGANVHATSALGGTALHCAPFNCVYASEVITILCGAGVDVMAKDSDGSTAFDLALSRSKAVADVFNPFLPPGFTSFVILSVQDPVGSFTCAAAHGGKLLSTHFAAAIPLPANDSWEVCWAHLRNGMPLLLDGSGDDAFPALVRSNDAELWKWASSEPQMQQHPISGDTIFHLLCRSEALTIEQKLVVLADLRLHSTIATRCACSWPGSPS